MKNQQVQIKITGGISGNRTILNALNSRFPESLPFNNWVIDYPSMREAEESLKAANKSLKEEGAFLVSSTRLRYDASVAEIINIS